MTYNEKKRYLESYSYSVRRIKNLQREYEEWTTIATNITQKLTPVIVKTNDNESKVERCAIRLDEIENEIIEELATAEYTRKEVKTTINTIRDIRKREILEMRYIQNIPVKKIAIELDKDADNIYKMIRKTIKNLEI